MNRTVINDGQDGRICPQGVVSWAQERMLFLEAYLNGNGSLSNFTNVPPPGIEPNAKPPKPTDPRTNEDCLFLNVIVPESVYSNNVSQSKKAPVMVRAP